MTDLLLFTIIIGRSVTVWAYSNRPRGPSYRARGGEDIIFFASHLTNLSSCLDFSFWEALMSLDK